jgi:hypothetical protein
MTCLNTDASQQTCQDATVTCGANACSATCMSLDHPTVTCGPACQCNKC